jgi:hypothetical protein
VLTVLLLPNFDGSAWADHLRNRAPGYMTLIGQEPKNPKCKVVACR